MSLLEDAPSAAQIRTEVRDWLAEHWSPDKDMKVFLEEAVDAGWVAPTFPPEFFGRNLSDELARVVTSEFVAAGAPQGSGEMIATHTLRAFGTTPELRALLHDVMTTKARTCLLYSEPGAGSDLAGLQTRAERDGDEWVVNGQKVWTSGAHLATHGLLAARTNWDVPKHKGISYFVLPMRQEGVEIRPIKQMNGHASFSEVFFNDARVDDAYRVGDLEHGWTVLRTALAVERMMLGGMAQARATAPRGPSGDGQGQGRQARGEGYFRGPVDFVALAKERGLDGDPIVRQAIARVHALDKIVTWSGRRAAGMADERVASVLKLSIAQLLHERARVQLMLLGTEALLVGDSSEAAEDANQAAMLAFPISIGGGSDQIQRNLIGERVLGLPKDPSADHDVPFKDVRKAKAVKQFS